MLHPISRLVNLLNHNFFFLDKHLWKSPRSDLDFERPEFGDPGHGRESFLPNLHWQLIMKALN